MELANREHKNILRKYLKEKRENISSDEILKRSIGLCKIVINSIEFNEAKTICSYLSFNKEIDTFYLLDKCLNLNKNLCVPVVTGNVMVFSKLFSLDRLSKSKFGVLEPQEIHEIAKNDVDLIIVPGLGFNKNGFRLGYGAGFYDKYLKNYKGNTIGMIFNEFIIDFEPEVFDISVKKLFIL